MVIRTKYTVYIDGAPMKFDDFDSAARYWDNNTWQLDKSPAGGISVQQYDDELVMVRDGWLIHVQENGVVYINPNFPYLPNEV